MRQIDNFLLLWFIMPLLLNFSVLSGASLTARSTNVVQALISVELWTAVWPTITFWSRFLITSSCSIVAGLTSHANSPRPSPRHGVRLCSCTSRRNCAHSFGDLSYARCKNQPWRPFVWDWVNRQSGERTPGAFMASSSVHRLGRRVRRPVSLTAAVSARALWFLSVRVSMPW